MRVRRQHAWGAILIALFALPVLRPRGIPALEGPVASFFAWWGKVPAVNPRLWGSEVSAAGEGGPRARALEEENALLREQIAQHVHQEGELRGLREALAVQGTSALDRMPRALVARVLRSTDASSQRRSIVIDRGAADGLLPGCPVVSGAVLVGRVETVQAHAALVKLVTDPGSRLEVAVRTEGGERLVGWVRGAGRGASEEDLEVRHLQVEDGAGRLLVGAPVFTSNADPLVPPGLLIGYVTEVTDRDLDGMPSVRMRPALSLRRALRVLVLLPRD